MECRRTCCPSPAKARTSVGAPVSAALIFWLYGSGIFAAAGFAEEILPGLDFVPTATIAWFLTQSDAGQRIGEKVTPEAAPKKQAEDLRDGAIDV